jgi:hypothetical protein
LKPVCSQYHEKVGNISFVVDSRQMTMLASCSAALAGQAPGALTASLGDLDPKFEATRRMMSRDRGLEAGSDKAWPL